MINFYHLCDIFLTIPDLVCLIRPYKMTSNSASGRRKRKHKQGRERRGSPRDNMFLTKYHMVTPALEFWYSVWSNETIYLIRKLSEDAERWQILIKKRSSVRVVWHTSLKNNYRTNSVVKQRHNCDLTQDQSKRTRLHL